MEYYYYILAAYLISFSCMAGMLIYNAFGLIKSRIDYHKFCHDSSNKQTQKPNKNLGDSQ